MHVALHKRSPCVIATLWTSKVRATRVRFRLPAGSPVVSLTGRCVLMLRLSSIDHRAGRVSWQVATSRVRDVRREPYTVWPDAFDHPHLDQIGERLIKRAADIGSHSLPAKGAGYEDLELVAVDRARVPE